MRDGTLPRAREALLADAAGTVAGAALGSSTVTAYIESSAGVSAGGRTGLAALVTNGLFLLSLFLYPLVRMIGAGYPVGQSHSGLPDDRHDADGVQHYRRGGLRVGFVRDPGPSGPTRLTPGKIGPARLRVCRSLHCPIRIPSVTGGVL
jgi:permease family protein